MFIPLRISHSDLDGLGAVLVDYFAKTHFNTKFIIINYDDIRDESGEFILHQIHPEIFSNRWQSITITDISIPIDIFIEKLEYKDIPIRWFDHHPPSIEFLDRKEEFPTIEVMEHSGDLCGAKLYYDWMFRGKRVRAVFREFIELVNTYDLWRQDSDLWEMAEDMNRFLTTQIDYKNKNATTFQKSVKFLDWMCNKFEYAKDKHFEFSDYEKSKILDVKAREYSYLKKAREEINNNVMTDSRGFRYAVFSSPAKISFIANAFLKELNLDYIIGVNTYKGLGRISVRSRKGYNVNDLMDVAGHECAGGGSLYPDRLEEVWHKGKELGYKNLDNSLSV